MSEIKIKAPRYTVQRKCSDFDCEDMMHEHLHETEVQVDELTPDELRSFAFNGEKPIDSDAGRWARAYLNKPDFALEAVAELRAAWLYSIADAMVAGRLRLSQVPTIMHGAAPGESRAKTCLYALASAHGAITAEDCP